MIASVRERFLPRFLESARARMNRARAMLDAGNELSAFGSEMHALAGEAAILEFTTVAKLAREGEAGARRSDRDACREALSALGPAVESLVP